MMFLCWIIAVMMMPLYGTTGSPVRKDNLLLELKIRLEDLANYDYKPDFLCHTPKSDGKKVHVIPALHCSVSQLGKAENICSSQNFAKCENQIYDTWNILNEIMKNEEPKESSERVCGGQSNLLPFKTFIKNLDELVQMYSSI